MHDVTGMSIASLQEAMARGETSAEEIAAAFLARIREKDDAVGAYLTVTEEEALAQARAVDARRARGLPAGALAGIPAAYKDNLCTRGVRTTCASKLLADYRPPYDAAAVERLQAAGAVMLGKTNLDEFAMGSSTEHSALGRTRNPRTCRACRRRSAVRRRPCCRGTGVWRWGRYRAAPSASRRRCAAWWACGRRMARFRAGGWSPSRPPWMRLAR